MNKLQILCAALAVALAVTLIPLGQQSYAHDGYWLEPIFTFDMPTEIAVGETVSMNYTVSWVDENGTPLHDSDKVGDNYDERPSKIILYLPDEIQITLDDVKLIKVFGTPDNSHMQGVYTRTIPYDTTGTITGTIEMKLLEPMFYEHDDIIFSIDSSRTTFYLQTVSTDNGIVIVDPLTDSRSDGLGFHLGIRDRYGMQFWHLEEETSQWSYNGRGYETNAKGFPDYVYVPEPKGQSSPSLEPQYIPRQGWDGFAEYLRLVESSGEAIVTKEWLLSEGDLLEEFVNDFFEEYPEFLTTDTDFTIE